MNEKLQELLDIAVKLEDNPTDTLQALLLSSKLLNFTEEHVLTCMVLKSGNLVEAMIPLASPLRNGEAQIISVKS